MMTFKYDQASSVAVFLFSGPTNTDRDFERYLEAIHALDAKQKFVDVPAMIIYVDRDNPMPNARWRRRIAEETRELKTKGAVVAFVGESPLLRGIVMAVSWIRPPPFEQTVVSTIGEAMKWVEARRGYPVKIIERLLDECRDEARALAAKERVG
jgi:hypothetical protein